MARAQRPAHRVAALAALLCAGAATVGAATVDVDYDQVRDLPLGKSLIEELKIDIPGAEKPYTETLRRLRLDWDGAKSPLLIVAEGVPAPELRQALLADGTVAPMATPLGDALPLPRDQRYHVLPIADDVVALGTAKGLGGFAVKPWPDPTGAALSFTGVPADLKLDEFSDRVDTVTMTLTREGMLIGKIHAKDRGKARGLMSYISNRLPLLNVAAAVGVDKAAFPKRMIDAAVIERSGSVITVTVDLAKDDALRKEAHEYLIKTLRRRMKKAS